MPYGWEFDWWITLPGHEFWWFTIKTVLKFAFWFALRRAGAAWDQRCRSRRKQALTAGRAQRAQQGNSVLGAPQASSQADSGVGSGTSQTSWWRRVMLFRRRS